MYEIEAKGNLHTENVCKYMYVCMYVGMDEALETFLLRECRCFFIFNSYLKVLFNFIVCI